MWLGYRTPTWETRQEPEACSLKGWEEEKSDCNLKESHVDEGALREPVTFCQRTQSAQGYITENEGGKNSDLLLPVSVFLMVLPIDSTQPRRRKKEAKLCRSTSRGRQQGRGMWRVDFWGQTEDTQHTGIILHIKGPPSDLMSSSWLWMVSQIYTRGGHTNGETGMT